MASSSLSLSRKKREEKNIRSVVDGALVAGEIGLHSAPFSPMPASTRTHAKPTQNQRLAQNLAEHVDIRVEKIREVQRRLGGKLQHHKGNCLDWAPFRRSPAMSLYANGISEMHGPDGACITDHFTHLPKGHISPHNARQKNAHRSIARALCIWVNGDRTYTNGATQRRNLKN